MWRIETTLAFSACVAKTTKTMAYYRVYERLSWHFATLTAQRGELALFFFEVSLCTHRQLVKCIASVLPHEPLRSGHWFIHNHVCRNLLLNTCPLIWSFEADFRRNLWLLRWRQVLTAYLLKGWLNSHWISWISPPSKYHWSHPIAPPSWTRAPSKSHRKIPIWNHANDVINFIFMKSFVNKM